MNYDAIVLGGGHNGLTAAALLARRGRRVVVLEARGRVGGLAAGEEFHPGHRSIGVLHDTSQVRQSVIESLGLQRHGLRRGAERAPVFAPQADGPGLLLHADPARSRDVLAAHAPADAGALSSFREFVGAVSPWLTRLMNEPPPLLAPKGFGEQRRLFGKAWSLRRLGRYTMYELLRVAPMCAADWLTECFASDLLKATIAAPALLGTWSGPWSAGTAALVLIHECLAAGEVVGGPAALVRALEAACREHGAEIRTGERAVRIVIEGGRVRGVELRGGEVVEAGTVLSSLDPRRTLLELVPPRDLPAGLAEPLRHWRCRGTTAAVHLALDGPLEFAGGAPGTAGAAGAVRICAGLDDLERSFDAVKYRELPEVPHLDIRVPTIDDVSLAPEGHHVVSILVHFVPHALEGGWTTDARDELLRRTLATLAAVAPTCTDRIVGHRVITPADLEQDYGLTGGHVHHGEHGLDQLLATRPNVACARYRTPLTGLFLCGSGTHPGGGITCAPGVLAVGAVD